MAEQAVIEVNPFGHIARGFEWTFRHAWILAIVGAILWSAIGPHY